MPLYNVTEALVRIVFNDAFLTKKDGLVCNCQKCQDDILAFALNHMKTRYVSSDEGNAYVKAQYLNQQLQSDITRELALGAELVGKNPKH